MIRTILEIAGFILINAFWIWMARNEERQKKDNCFWSKSPFESQILDRFKYRGRGRPRKHDYSPFGEVQAKLNAYRNQEIEKESERIW